MNGEMEEFDEQEKERRKNEQITYRKIQKNSNLFLLVGTIFEVIISVVTVFVLFLLSILLLYRVIGLTESSSSLPLNILLVVDFFGGLFIGLIVYRTLGRLVIKKWKLEGKLREDVINQFKTRKEYKEYMNKKKSR